MTLSNFQSIRGHSLARYLAFWIASVCVCLGGPGFAQIPDFYEEPGLYPNREYVSQHFSEHIDPFTGTVKLSQVDIHIPGNGGFDISVRRTYNNPQSRFPQNSPVGTGWTMHFGRVVRSATSPGLCTNDPVSTMDNPVIELSDGTSKLLYAVGFTAPIEWVTVDYWRARCNASGQMQVYSPEGMEYIIEKIGRNEGMFSSVYNYYATRIADKFGNYMNLVYSSQGVLTRLDSVNAFDYNGTNQRTVTFNYATHSPSGNPYLTSATANGFTWSYTVNPVPDTLDLFYLSRVTRPGVDGSYWQYTYYGATGTGAYGAPGAYALQQLRYPGGGTINYSYGFLFNFDPSNLSGSNTVVTSKTVAGGQNNGTWSFSYASSLSHDETTVTTPIGTEKYQHFGLQASAVAGQGNLWKVGLLLRKEILQSGVSNLVETYGWTNQQISPEIYRRKAGLVTLQDPFGSAPLMSSKTITRDGGTYTTSYSGFDAYGNPATVSETGPGGSRTVSLTYCINPAKWLIRANADQTISTSYAGTVGSITRSMDATYCLPNSETRYGVTTSYAYHSTGDVSSKTDFNSKTVNYSNYKRGIAQTETPTHADGPNISRTVSDAGNITQETIGTGGASRSYTYDGLNRLTDISFAGGNAVLITYLFIYPNTTSRTLTRGGYTETTTYDGFGRVIGVNRGGINTTMTYDALGRKTFESYPGSGSGMSYDLDVLGRVTTLTQPSPTGSGNVARTTTFGASSISVLNERGFTETQTFRVYANPDERFLTGISYASLSAANLTIATNDLGQTTSATQGGKTRTFGYNGSYFLTSETHPETGTTTYGRDAVGNMSSKTVTGQPASTYSYDGSNRLKTAIYSGGSITAPNVSYTYANDGKPTGVTHASGTNPVTRSFTYNVNRNIQTDGMTVDGLTFTATYGYDGNDQLSSITYPRTGTAVNYAPNALGRPTLVNVVNNAVTAPIASSVAFYPSGQLQSFVRSNGVTESLGQNTRQMTSSVGLSKNTTLASHGYTYDAGGNLAAQSESAADAAYALTLGYDALDRINAVNGGSISYDGGGNITAKNLPGTGSYSFGYDASNRLQSLSGAVSRSFTYDGYGNVAGNGLGTFVYDSAANLRRASVTAPAPAAIFDYLYDGKNQRVRSVKDNGYALYSFHALDGDLLLDYDSASGKMAEYIYLAGRQIARLDRTPATVSLTVTPSMPAVQPNQAFNLIGAVGGGAGGTVTFSKGGVGLGTVNLVGGTATLALPAGLAAGAHSITARYNGDTTHAPREVTLIISVGSKRFDFDGDGKADVLWRNTTTGENFINVMDGASVKPTPPSGYAVTVTDQNWQVAAVGDMDGDGKADVLYRHNVTGENYVYLMDGLVHKTASAYLPSVPLDWKVAGIGDFDGDGKADVLWRNTATGENFINMMDGAAVKPTPLSGYIVTVTDQNWQVAAVGDMDGDGKADVLWRNAVTGDNYVYLMDGLVHKTASAYLPSVPLDWKVAGIGDFDGDGKADVLWRNTATGENFINMMDGAAVKPTPLSGYIVTVTDQNWQVAAVGDMDGDGKADILYRHNVSGENYVYLMDGLVHKPSSAFITTVPLQWNIVNGR